MPHPFEWRGMSVDGNMVTLKKFDGIFHYAVLEATDGLQEMDEDLGTGVVLDLETTGLSQTNDKIIEIALRKFRFQRKDGEIIAVAPSYSELQDPGMPLSPQIQLITGLTDEQLTGKSIDWHRVETELSDADIVIAHNASFDRPFVERFCATAVHKLWGCSASQVDWRSKGYTSSKLEMLSIYHGFFVDAHRALSDIDALLYLISMKDESTQRPYLFEILTNAIRPTVLLIARQSPFDSKDLLKQRGYTWNVAIKSWQKKLYKDKLEEETEWLKTSIYKGKFLGEAHEIPTTETFRMC